MRRRGTVTYAVECFGPSHDKELTAELFQQAPADLRPQHIDEEVGAPDHTWGVTSIPLVAFAGALDDDTWALSIAPDESEDATIECAQRIR